MMNKFSGRDANGYKLVRDDINRFLSNAQDVIYRRSGCKVSFLLCLLRDPG